MRDNNLEQKTKSDTIDGLQSHLMHLYFMYVFILFRLYLWFNEIWFWQKFWEPQTMLSILYVCFCYYISVCMENSLHIASDLILCHFTFDRETDHIWWRIKCSANWPEKKATENKNRAPNGQPYQFSAKRIHNKRLLHEFNEMRSCKYSVRIFGAFSHRIHLPTYMEALDWIRQTEIVIQTLTVKLGAHKMEVS